MAVTYCFTQDREYFDTFWLLLIKTLNIGGKKNLNGVRKYPVFLMIDNCLERRDWLLLDCSHSPMLLLFRMCHANAEWLKKETPL